METALRKARDRRDEIIEKAHTDFDQAVANAYAQGWSLHDLHLATGVSITTLRVRLQMAGVELRRIGRTRYTRRTPG